MYVEPESHPDTALKFVMGLSLASHEVTGLEPLAKLAFIGHAQDALQQSQYLVVVPLPEAWALAWTKNGTRARRIFFGRAMVTEKWNLELSDE
jgi:hypothetical protein